MVMMSSTYTTLNNRRVPPYDTILRTKDYFIPKPRSTPSSTPISLISNPLVIIRNYWHAQAFIAQIHRLDVSTKMEVSTLASSTLHRYLEQEPNIIYWHDRKPCQVMIWLQIFINNALQKCVWWNHVSLMYISNFCIQYGLDLVNVLRKCI